MPFNIQAEHFESAGPVIKLICGYAPEVWERKLILMLEGLGYIDDSGSARGQGLFVLAGYVMPSSQWLEFSADWKKELDRQPTISYFKSFEAFDKSGEFSMISKEVRECKLRELASVIQKYKPIRLATSIRWTDYDSVFRGKVPIEIDDPYYILFYRILELMIICREQITDFEPHEKVDFVFDEQGEIGAGAVQWYYHVKESCTPDIRTMLGKTPVFEDDKITLPLQAADMVAWQLRHKYEYPQEESPILPLISPPTLEILDREYLLDLLRRSISTENSI